jgi:glycosyltransferase involved in cell wall biosynthesis
VNLNKDVFVSVVVPCYQEINFIGRCLESLAVNNYPKDRLEILVFDGGSTDGTRDIVKKICEKYDFIKLLDNRARFQPQAMNAGISKSRGDIIIRCDAHARYEVNYIKKLVFHLVNNPRIGNVGGVWLNVPASKSLKAEAIAYSLGSSMCVGLNRYRTGAKKPSYVDTVPFGAWRKEVFEEVGLFDNDFLRAQDLEFNFRLKKAGYRILLDPDIKCYYYPRDRYGSLFKMMYQYGYWKNFVNRKAMKITSFRQLAPAFFVLYMFFLPLLAFKSAWFIAPLLLYILLAAAAGVSVAVRRKKLKLFPLCAFTFLTAHAGYGAGYIEGFWNIFLRARKRPRAKHTDITR